MAGTSEKQEITEPAETAVGAGPLSFDVPAEAGHRGVIVTGADHRIQYTDSSIGDLLDIDPSALIGKDFEEVAAGILKDRFSDPEAFEQRCRWLAEHPHETAEDVMTLVSPRRRVLHRYSTPLLDADRRPIGRVEVYSDITKRRQLEETNTALYKQVSSAYQELKATQGQLLQSEKLRAVGEIASGVAHDFNNTLGIILGNIQLLARAIDDPKLVARLQSVEQAARDGAETVRRIQEFTRIQPDEAGSAVDLSELVRAVVEMMRPSWESLMQARDRHLSLDLDLDDGALAVGIATEIREVLANILLNAVQAMPDGGTIRVSTGRSDGMVWVRASDTGIGMTEEVRKRIFDPFFTTRGVEGTGLGMSVAYGIVKRHRGKITVDSAPGEGTTITISLPAAENSGVAEKESKDAEPSAVAARILVVDDEERFAEVFVDMLAEYGHAVCVARSGREAIRQFRESPFDLVFTDLGMPEMSGWQVARSIKDIKPSTPVVLLTGWGAKVDEGRLAESMVDMVLSKPINLNDLSAIVSQALSGSGK